MCYMMCIIYWSHNLGYIYTNYASKPLNDQPSIMLAQWFEISPVTFLLYMNGIDPLTIIVWVVFITAVLSFYVTLILLVMIKIFKSEMIVTINNNNYFLFYKKMMNIFFQSFIWFFYIPMIEINLGMSFCGANSFLVVYRDETKCSEHPIILKFMGILCFLLTFLLCIVIIVFF